jgi:hypothetical protein
MMANGFISSAGNDCVMSTGRLAQLYIALDNIARMWCAASAEPPLYSISAKDYARLMFALKAATRGGGNDVLLEG